MNRLKYLKKNFVHKNVKIDHPDGIKHPFSTEIL